MREIQAKVHILAPIDQVWKVITDFDNWKDWNPTIKQVSGEASIGSKLTITMCGKDDKDGQKYQPTVLEVDPLNRFRWRVKMMGGFIFTNDRVFELKEKDGGTELINMERFSGLMATMAWSKLNEFVPTMLESMNLALKEKLESQ